VENENLDTLLTALYVKLDDEIEGTRRMGRPPLLTGSGLVCLAVALPGYERGARCASPASTCPACSPYLPQQSGYNSGCGQRHRW